MRIFRVAVAALGYTVAVIGAAYAGTRALAWMYDNLTYPQGMLVCAAVFFAWMVFPAKHFTNNGQRWPWEPKQ